MNPWLKLSLRLTAALAVTGLLWWAGGRWLGVSAAPASAGEAFVTVGWVAIIGLCWFPILGLPLLAWLGNLAGGLFTPSDAQFGVRPDFSIAEARAQQGRYAEAIAAFRADSERFPDEITPHVRIAELLLAQFKDVDGALAEFERARQKTSGDDAFALLSQRLADLHLHEKQDPAAARRCLEQIIERDPAGKHAAAARIRLTRL